MTEPAGSPERDEPAVPAASESAASAAAASSESGSAGVTRPAPDPWKGFRGVLAATLILEAIVVLLTL
ncbi:MAG: hypothetical protein QOC75_2155, partial [Pseudonocardiales bacterium]|nr:hypothetical protein [Pseudonocardiales bacterium]